MMLNKLLFILVLFAYTLNIQTAFSQPNAQTNTTDSQVEVMVLGTFHFSHTPDYYDIMSSGQQKELKKILNSLEDFTPTKIMLEASYTDTAKFDSLYTKYREGEHLLSSNERQQVGFRLADQLNHEKIYVVDYKLSWPYQEVMSWAKENKPEFIDFYNKWKQDINSYEAELYKNDTLREHLLWLNSDSYRDRLKALRMKRLELGAGSNFVGTKPISSSFERNLKIFANVTKYAEAGDRIFVLFGASHGYFLREFVDMHPEMKLVEVEDYL